MRTFDSEEKDLPRYFKHNLIGFGAGGASVNFGHKGGFIVKLRAFTNRNIYSVWCMPHRLELAVKVALKENIDMTKIDEATAALAKFYGSYTRRARLHSEPNKHFLLLFLMLFHIKTTGYVV